MRRTDIEENQVHADGCAGDVELGVAKILDQVPVLRCLYVSPSVNGVYLLYNGRYGREVHESRHDGDI